MLKLMTSNDPESYLYDIARAEIDRAGRDIDAAIEAQDRLCIQLGLGQEERLRFKKILLCCLREKITANGS